MAGTLLSTLYPPVLSSTFAEAFVDTGSARVYFSISSFNSAADISRVQVSVSNQKTNESVVNTPTSVLFFEGLTYDSVKGQYYVEISPLMIKKGTGTGWNNGQYYMVQLRFDGNREAGINDDDYLSNNLSYFSEWSEVCLLRPIAKPILSVLPWDLDSNKGEDSPAVFNEGIVSIVGNVTFDSSNSVRTETETVERFVVDVLPQEGEEAVLSSGNIYTSATVNPNSLNYLLDMRSVDTSIFNGPKIRVKFFTKGGYSESKLYPFELSEYIVDESFTPEVKAVVNDDKSCVEIVVENFKTVLGALIVKRGSSLGNFKDWEPIGIYAVAGTISQTIVDNTVCSGVWYKYSAQLQNSLGTISQPYDSTVVFPNFYDVVMSRGDKQLSLSYNCTVSNLKPVVNRQKVETLGGKYPKFAENAALDYRQFSVSALISSESDVEHTFLNKKDYYGSSYSIQQDMDKALYKGSSYLEESENYLWERQFREEVTKWLNDGEPKLYRSLTEGNLAVMVTDVSLTPNETLGRRLWNLSATCYEIEDGSKLSVLDSLGIYDVPGVNDGDDEEIPVPKYVLKKEPGQLYRKSMRTAIKNDLVANQIMADKRRQYVGIKSNKLILDGTLKDVRIQFVSRPHPFIQTKSGLKVVENPSSYSAADRKKMILGYSFEALSGLKDSAGETTAAVSSNDSTLFFVGEDGYYQIPADIDVKSLSFPQTEDVVTVEYVLEYKEEINPSSQVTATVSDRVVVGQYRGIFAVDDSLASDILKKYFYFVPEQYYQEMQWWKGVCVEADPYTIFKIRYQGDVDSSELMVGSSGVLNLMNDFPVEELTFLGRRMNDIPVSRIRYCRDWEYVDFTDTSYSSLGEIENPQIHGVYAVGDKQYLYYVDYRFYELIDSDYGKLLKNSTQGAVNYYGQVLKHIY